MAKSLTILLEGHERRVDSQGKFHRQLGRDDTGDDENTVKQQFALDHAPLESLDPDVGGSCNGEDEQEADEKEGLKGVGRDALGGEDHGSNELTLGGAETGTENDGETTTIWS